MSRHFAYAKHVKRTLAVETKWDSVSQRNLFAFTSLVVSTADLAKGPCAAPIVFDVFVEREDAKQNIVEHLAAAVSDGRGARDVRGG